MDARRTTKHPPQPSATQEADSRPPNANPLLDDRNWLESRYAAGEPVERIAKEAGASVSAVWRAVKRHGIDLRGRTDVRSWSEIFTPEYLTDLLDDGWTPHAIAVAHECSQTVVNEWMARHQLVAIDRNEAALLRRWYETNELSIDAVATKLGVHPRTARRRLLAAGVELRKPGRRSGR